MATWGSYVHKAMGKFSGHPKKVFFFAHTHTHTHTQRKHSFTWSSAQNDRNICKLYHRPYMNPRPLEAGVLGGAAPPGIFDEPHNAYKVCRKSSNFDVRTFFFFVFFFFFLGGGACQLRSSTPVWKWRPFFWGGGGGGACLSAPLSQQIVPRALVNSTQALPLSPCLRCR